MRIVVVRHPLRAQPRSISARRMGVGAVLWDGSLALAAYLTTQPLHRYIGLRCVQPWTRLPIHPQPPQGAWSWALVSAWLA